MYKTRVVFDPLTIAWALLLVMIPLRLCFCRSAVSALAVTAAHSPEAAAPLGQHVSR